MREAFRALSYRNYRLFFFGQTFSLIGTWMQTIAMSWLVYRLTGSEVLLGVVAFCSQIPMFVASPLAGLAADRHDRRRLLILTQVLAMLQALALAVLVLTNTVQPWHIIALSIFIGIVNAYDVPARQAFVPQIVEDRNLLSNAIALNSTQFNLARLIGPAVAGIVIAEVGEGLCFLFNGVSYLAVIVALSMMRLPAQLRAVEGGTPLERLRAGAWYAWQSHPIRALLQLMAILSLVAGVYSVLLPVLAKEVYGGDSRTMGYLFGAIAVGALGSAWMLAMRKTVVGLGRWIVVAATLFCVGVGALAAVNSFWLALPCLAVAGFGAMLHMGATNTLLQTIVDDNMRGRVMAFYTMAFVGTMPLGSLLGGSLANALGSQWTLAIAAFVGLLGAIRFYQTLPELRRILRPVYEQMGILEPTG